MKLLEDMMRWEGLRNRPDSPRDLKDAFASWVVRDLRGIAYQVALGSKPAQTVRFPVAIPAARVFEANSVDISCYLDDIKRRYAKQPNERRERSLRKYRAHITKPIDLSWKLVREIKDSQVSFLIDVSIAQVVSQSEDIPGSLPHAA